MSLFVKISIVWTLLKSEKSKPKTQRFEADDNDSFLPNTMFSQTHPRVAVILHHTCGYCVCFPFSLCLCLSSHPRPAQEKSAYVIVSIHPFLLLLCFSDMTILATQNHFVHVPSTLTDLLDTFSKLKTEL